MLNDLAATVELAAAMTRVLDEAAWARKAYSDTFAPTTVEWSIGAGDVRQSITKGAFAELRAACVRQGSSLTGEFLDLEREIDNFALQCKDWASGTETTMVRKGANADLSKQLAEIETKAKALREKALGMVAITEAILNKLNVNAPQQVKAG